MKPNPFLHVEEARIYNPLTDRALTPGDAEYQKLRTLLAGEGGSHSAEDEALARDGWIVAEGEDLSTRYRLKIVSLEVMTTCNQKCYFCPVSIAPREDYTMPEALFDGIVNQLTAFRSTLEAVFLQSYNEPSLDRRFVAHIRAIHDAGLPVAVLSNGSAFTPAKTQALLPHAPRPYLSVNLSPIKRERSLGDRG